MVGGSPHREASPMPGAKETGQGKDVLEDDGPEERGGAEAAPGRASRSARKGEVATPGEPPHGHSLPPSAPHSPSSGKGPL